MIPEARLSQRIIHAHNVRRWYQRMPYMRNEVKTHFEDGKTNKKSYDDGRWDNYIYPMMVRMATDDGDVSNSTFCEIGCSAGLFLLRAWEKFGFKRLIGVEAADGGYAQLKITRDYYDKMSLKAWKLGLGPLTDSIADSYASELNVETFPIVDVTLMSCVHYHMEIKYLVNYLHKLSTKSMYFMLLTDENAGGPTNATSRFFGESLINPDEWELISKIGTNAAWLTHTPPCKDLTVLLYKSNLLKRLLVSECYEKQVNWHKDKIGKHAGWYEYAQEFYTEVFPRWVNAVLGGRVNTDNYKDSLVYKWQREGQYDSTAWDEKISSERTLSYINIVLTLAEYGQEQPIGLQEHLSMVDPWDGWHRVAVAKYLGLKYIYGVDVIPKG